MRTINCYVPLKLKLSGQLSEDDWAALEEALVAQYTRALRRSLEEMARSRHTGPADLMQEIFDPVRDTSEGYLIPSFDNGQPTPVPTDVPAMESGGPAPPTIERIVQMIRERFPDTNGLPSSDGTHYGVYVTLQGTSAPELFYLDAKGQIKQIRYFRKVDDEERPIVLDAGSYTL